MIKLGDKVKDSITGFSGIVVARTEWLNGCARITVQPEKTDKDGKVPETHTFDEPQLTVSKEAKYQRGSTNTGGPRPEPEIKKSPTH